MSDDYFLPDAYYGMPDVLFGVDEYGIPNNWFGPVEERFYAMVGRVVMVANVVELRLFDLLSELDREHAQDFAGRPVGWVIKECRQRLSSHDQALRSVGLDLLGRVGTALADRNAIVHSLWPRPTYRWRMVDKKRRPATGEPIVGVATTEEEQRELIRRFVSLEEELNRFRYTAQVAVERRRLEME